MTAPVRWRSNPGIRVTINAGLTGANSINAGGVATGEVLATTAAAITGDLAGRVLIEDVSVRWGTADPLTQPDPSTASLVLLDRSLTWAARANLMRAPVLIEWLPDAPLIAAGVPTGRVYFRGRVTSVAISAPEVFRAPDGSRYRAARVKLGLTSVEVDLANRFVTDGSSWPQETVGARAARIAALAGTTVTVRDYWKTPVAAAVPAADLAGKSARELLLQLYNSSGGDRMIWSPHTQTYEWMGRRQNSFRGMAMLRGSGRGRAGEGIFATCARFSSRATTDTSDLQNGTYLDGQFLTGGDELAKTAGQRITRSQVTYTNVGTNATGTAVTVDPLADESVLGRNAITLTSLHTEGAGSTGYAAVNSSDLLAMATQEGAAWRPPPLVFDTALDGGFGAVEQVQLSLRGHATLWRLFVNRSWFSQLAVRPVFSPIGGTTTYRGGRWIIEYQLAGWASTGGGFSSPDPVKQHPIAWDDVDPDPERSMMWTDGPALTGFHESLTYEDMRFVSQGYSTATTEAPDAGWDEYQG